MPEKQIIMQHYRGVCHVPAAGRSKDAVECTQLPPEMMLARSCRSVVFVTMSFGIWVIAVTGWEFQCLHITLIRCHHHGKEYGIHWLWF